MLTALLPLMNTGAPSLGLSERGTTTSAGSRLAPIPKPILTIAGQLRRAAGKNKLKAPEMPTLRQLKNI
jgi:hypothetical protein